MATNDNERDVDRHVKRLQAQRAIDDATLRLATGMDSGSVDLHVHGQHDAGAREDRLPAIVPIEFVIGEQFTNEQVDDSYQRLQRLRTMDEILDDLRWSGVDDEARARWEAGSKPCQHDQRSGRIQQGGGPAYLDAADVCEFCANGEHEIAVRVGEVCGCRCHGQQLSPPCPVCASPATHKPSHNGSPRCQSGSPASGGRNAHCSCSICF